MMGRSSNAAVMSPVGALLLSLGRTACAAPYSCPTDGTGLEYGNAHYNATTGSSTPTAGPKLPSITPRQARTYGVVGPCVGTAAEGFDGGEIVVGATVALYGQAATRPYAKIMRHTIEIFLDWLNLERHIQQHNVTGGL